MRFILASVVSLASLASAFPVEKLIDAPKPLILGFDIVDKEKVVDSDSIMDKSFSNKSRVVMAIESRSCAYIANVGLGTPAQNVQVQVDTGSSDLWVPELDMSGTNSISVFNKTASETFNTDNKTFFIKYYDSSWASGLWGKDVVTLGDQVINSFEFAVATKRGDQKQGVLGIGVKNAESSLATDGEQPWTYDNLPWALKQNGLIKKASYSLYLNGRNASSGLIMFGIIDHKKFAGEKLNMFPMVKKDGRVESLKITLDKITYNAQDGDGSGEVDCTTDVKANNLPAMLDSGTYLIYAPFDVVHNIGKKFGKFVLRAGGYLTSCSTKGSPISFHFKTASGDQTVIEVPFKNLLVDVSKEDPFFSAGECLIGIVNSPTDEYILGDYFLRSAYVYYDLESELIGLGQAVYTDESELIEVVA